MFGFGKHDPFYKYNGNFHDPFKFHPPYCALITMEFDISHPQCHGNLLNCLRVGLCPLFFSHVRVQPQYMNTKSKSLMYFFFFFFVNSGFSPGGWVRPTRSMCLLVCSRWQAENQTRGSAPLSVAPGSQPKEPKGRLFNDPLQAIRRVGSFSVRGLDTLVTPTTSQCPGIGYPGYTRHHNHNV